MGAKSWMKSWFVTLVVVIAFVGGGSAYGFSLLDGKMKVGGFLRNDFGVRVHEGGGWVHPGWETGDLYLFRNTFQLEVNYDMTEMLSLFTIYRGFYDAAMDFDHDIEERIAPHVRKDFKRDSDLREIYVDLKPEKWQIRVGRQQIVWGESDGFRMADIINSLDYSWHYFFPSWEDIRIPQWAVRAIYSATNKLSLELVFQPCSFDRGFIPTGFPPQGANWAFANFPQFFIDSIRRSKPEKSLRSAEYGFRAKYNLQWIDVGVFGLYSRNKNPVLKENWLTNPGLATGSPSDYFQFPFDVKVGGTFNAQLQQTIPGFGTPAIRGECVFTYMEPFNSVDMVSDPAVFKRNTFAYMLGYDANFFNYKLNPTGASFYHSMQVFQKFISGHNSRITSGEMQTDSFQTLITYYINTNYMNGKFTPSSFSMYNPTGAWWTQFQLAYAYGRNWNFTLGYQYMWAKQKNESYFGFARDNNEIYGSVRFSW